MLSTERILEMVNEVSRDPLRFRNVIGKAVSKLQFEARLRGDRALIKLRPEDVRGFIVFGDLHGDLNTFLELLEKVGVGDLLTKNYRLVLLGDYVDRGPMQVEVLSAVAIIKDLLGEKAIVLRGNHEVSPWLPVYPHDYPQHLAYHFGERVAEELYVESLKFFESLPLALYVPGKMLAVHGGPPITRLLSSSSADEVLRDLYSDRVAVEEILWSDPIDEDIEYAYSYRGAGKLWGKPVTRRALEVLNIEFIVRGHEPCLRGYKLDHDGRVLTLFSMKGFYGNVEAACAVIDLDRVGKESLENFVVTA